MATITPTFKLISTQLDSGTGFGPSNFALSLNETDALTVVNQSISEYTIDTGANSVLVDGSNAMNPLGTSPTPTVFTPGTHGCFLYMKNTSALETGSPLAANTAVICVGIGADGLDPEVDDSGADLTLATTASARTFSLKAGEFAYFPFDFCGDIVAQATAAGQTLELIRFDRSLGQ